MKSITILDKDYLTWVQALCERYRKSQIKAAVKVNQEMLYYYWLLGKDIAERDDENKYGSAFYAALSRDLKKMMPKATGLSESSIRYAKRFYVLYNKMFGNLQQVAEDLLLPIFNVPWGHHLLLIDRFSDSPEKAVFFVNQIIANGWSRDNPTIGILICKEKDNLIAQYALEASNLPLGISEYDLERLYPEKVEGTIPTIDELEKGILSESKKRMPQGI